MKRHGTDRELMNAAPSSADGELVALATPVDAYEATHYGINEVRSIGSELETTVGNAKRDGIRVSTQSAGSQSAVSIQEIRAASLKGS